MTQFDKFAIKKRATYGAFLRRQILAKPPVTTHQQVDLAEKTAIITGSNTGLGLECSRQLLDLGLGKLILAVRSEKKGEQARSDLLSGRVAGKHTIEVWELDLSDMDSILSFSKRAESLDRLDIFINNAGIVKRKFELNKSGYEETVQVNYLSLVLISVLMLPILKNKNPGRVGQLVNVSSDTPSWAKFQEKDSIPLLPAFNDPENFDLQDRYATSKLLGQMFMKELASRVPASVCIINAPNPGLCKSGLVREFQGTVMGAAFATMQSILSRTTAVGARALTDAAVNHGPESHGHYLEDGIIEPWAPFVYSPEGSKVSKLLWLETMEVLKFAGVPDIIHSLSKTS